MRENYLRSYRLSRLGILLSRLSMVLITIMLVVLSARIISALFMLVAILASLLILLVWGAGIIMLVGIPLLIPEYREFPATMFEFISTDYLGPFFDKFWPAVPALVVTSYVSALLAIIPLALSRKLPKSKLLLTYIICFLGGTILILVFVIIMIGVLAHVNS